jgi:hypothetical protein
VSPPCDPEPRPGPPAAIQLAPNPIAIVCDGIDVSRLDVRVTDNRGRPVADGTPVFFQALSGTADPPVAFTYDGEASTHVRLFGPGGVVVEVGELRVTIDLRCTGGPVSPPPSPPSPPASTARLSIDADPTNGSAPCDPVDAFKQVTTGEIFAVGLCIEDAQLPPVNGAFVTGQFSVNYDLPLTASDVNADPIDGLDENPDWNEEGLGGASEWDCNALDVINSAPNATPSPAWIVCSTNDVRDQEIPENALLAMLRFDAPQGTGTTELRWNAIAPGRVTALLAGRDEPFCEQAPPPPLGPGGPRIPCIGATIEVTHGEAPAPAGRSPDSWALEIDTDITNGNAPCDPVDPVRTAPPNSDVQVGLCQWNPPAGITTATLTVDYSGPITGANVASDLNFDLDANPDWNEDGLGGTDRWDCNRLDALLSAPRAAPSPATMTCDTRALTDQPVSSPVLLAVLTLTTTHENGVAQLDWILTSILSGSREGICHDSMQCLGATINVEGDVEPETPAATATPTAVPTATPTPTPAPGTTSLWIDADPTNGNAPCDPIDREHHVAVAEAFAVGMCIQDAHALPLGGGFVSGTFSIDYSAPLMASDVVDDLNFDLDANPDWNQGDLGEDAWDCNRLDAMNAAPSAHSSPAWMVCDARGLVDHPVPNDALIATLAFDVSQEPGTVGLNWNVGSGLTGPTKATHIASGRIETACEQMPMPPSGTSGPRIPCHGATIIVGDGVGAAATSTAVPTATATAPVTRTAVVTGTSSPRPPRTAVPTTRITRTPVHVRCADVTGDGRVTKRDVMWIARQAAKKRPDMRADIARNGRVNLGDVIAAVRQLGRRC